MSAIDNSNPASSVLDQYANTTKNAEKPKTNEMGQDEFLKLMIAELNNQNPLDPQDNGEFIAQLAQFSTVEGLDKLNTTADGMSDGMRSSQALQASSLVGQSVIVKGNDLGLLLNKGIISSQTDLPDSASDLKLNIQDENGQLLEQIDLGNHAKGEMTVRWDGLNLMLDGKIVDLDYAKLNRQEFYVDENGEQVLDESGQPIQVPYPAGEYSFKVTGNTGGKTEEFATLMSARVDSVSLSPTGSATLNLAGGKRAAMADIKQIVNE
jgi:flagellar basal-body rod modification protein FlgD|tara:strand:- start:25 stop:822 length:798 start_codon:yes stop_codon:yes gene_type:complete